MNLIALAIALLAEALALSAINRPGWQDNINNINDLLAVILPDVRPLDANSDMDAVIALLNLLVSLEPSIPDLDKMSDIKGFIEKERQKYNEEQADASTGDGSRFLESFWIDDAKPKTAGAKPKKEVNGELDIGNING